MELCNHFSQGKTHIASEYSISLFRSLVTCISYVWIKSNVVLSCIECDSNVNDIWNHYLWPAMTKREQNWYDWGWCRREGRKRKPSKEAANKRDRRIPHPSSFLRGKWGRCGCTESKSERFSVLGFIRLWNWRCLLVFVKVSDYSCCMWR